MSLREVNIRLIKSIRMKKCDSHRMDFRDIYYLGPSTKIYRTSIVVKSDKNKKYLHEDMQILAKIFMTRAQFGHDGWEFSFFTIKVHQKR